MNHQVPVILKNLGRGISKNSPQILTGLGCIGVVSTAIVTGQATLKAQALIQTEETCRHHEKNYAPLTRLEMLQLSWKFYIPTVLIGATSIACIIGAHNVNIKRIEAMTTLYSLSKVAFREYKDQVVKEIGKNRELKVRDDVAGNKIAANPPGDRTIIVTGNGDVLCYDFLCDRYFESSAEKIRQQVLELNYTLMTDMWLDLNDLYFAIGLRSTKLGGMVGFDIDKGKIEVNYSSHLTPEGRPCLVVEPVVYPKYIGKEVNYG